MVDFTKPQLKHEEVDTFRSRFILEPLERGFGATLGNSMRRVLLSSLPGAAITNIRIDGVPHEFDVIKGMREDVTDLIMNLKEVRIKSDSKIPVVVTIEEKGPKDVFAKDIKCPAGVEIVSKDGYICNLANDGKIKMELTVGTGRGYYPAEKNKNTADPIGVIPIDSIFTPVKKVSFNIENTRVGQITDYDKLIVDVETDGSITPEEAVSMSASIINQHVILFEEQAERTLDQIFKKEQTEEVQLTTTPVEELGLSVRAYNNLQKQGINYIEQLKELSERDLLSIKGMGDKSIDIIKDKLKELSLELKV